MVMSNKTYYQTLEKKTSNYNIGRSGTEYYHNTAGSQEFYEAAEFALEWGLKLDDLFINHIATTVWYTEAWQGVKRNAKAGKGKGRTPRQAFEELLELMDKGVNIWQSSVDYGMPAPGWEKWNAVVDQGFKFIEMMDRGKPNADFDYADAMTMEFVQTLTGKPPLNTFADLMETA